MQLMHHELLMACLALVQCNYSGVVSIDLSIEVFHFVLLKLWLDKNASPPPFFVLLPPKLATWVKINKAQFQHLRVAGKEKGNFFWKCSPLPLLTLIHSVLLAPCLRRVVTHSCLLLQKSVTHALKPQGLSGCFAVLCH